MEFKKAIAQVIDRIHLSQEEAYETANTLMSGGATESQIGALLVALRMKGETIDEITGFVKSMREKATVIPTKASSLVDTCGTGGDASGTFNISTVSAFVAAGAGCNIAKHGNRSVSSQCGSADLFKELGVNIELTPEQVGASIDQNGIGFLFAPLLHGAMKYAIGPRREVGVRTIFNILGPMTNPAGAKRQLLGVFNGALTEPVANVLKNLGSEHVMVVHGEDGLDEITLTGKTSVSELKHGEIKTYTIEPEDFDLESTGAEAIKGGDASENAKIALDILSGKKGGSRDIVLLNAGAVCYVAGLVDSLESGMALAKESIDSGKAMEKVEALRAL